VNVTFMDTVNGREHPVTHDNGTRIAALRLTDPGPRRSCTSC